MPRLLALFIAVVVLVLGVMMCLPLLRQKAFKKRVQLELIEERDREAALGQEYRRRIESVRNDPTVVERLARESFGLGRTGEVIFKFKAPDAGAPTNASAPAARAR